MAEGDQIQQTMNSPGGPLTAGDYPWHDSADQQMTSQEPPQKLAPNHARSKALLMTLPLSHPPQLIMQKP